MGGEADSYYNPGQGAPAPPPQYRSYQQPGPYHAYQQPPPLQQQPPPPPQQQYGAPVSGYDELNEKQSFDQTFKIEKPKWNDLWAGILVGHRSLPAVATQSSSLYR